MLRHRFTLLMIFLLTARLVSGQSSQSYSLKASFSGGAAMSTSSSYQLSVSVGNPLSGNASSASFVSATGSTTVITNPAADLIFVESAASPGSVAPGEKVTITFTVKNNGTLPVQSPIVVKAYLSDNTTFEPGVDTELSPSFTVASSLGPNLSSVFPPPGTGNQVTIPAGTTEKSYQLLLVIDPSNSIDESNKANNFAVKSVTVSSGAGGQADTTGPSLSDIAKPASFTPGSQISITATDNSGVQSVVLMYRKITGSTWEQQAATASNTRYSVALAQSWADEVGIEFYFTAADNLNNKTDGLHFFLYNPVPVDQPIPGLASGGGLDDYRIFSIPYDLEEDRIDEIFKTLGDYDKTKWRIVRFQGGKNVDKKDGLTKIERGQGFWFNSIDKAEIKIGAGSTVNKDETPDFSMRLEKGYNQIGNPFTFDIDWADVITANPAVSTKLAHILLTYDNVNISLNPGDVLKSWSGGFVLADEEMTISMPVALKNAAGRVASTRIENSDPDQREWRLPIHVGQGGVLNSMAGIGMHPDASGSKDIYDIITPPRFAKYVGLSTSHADFFQQDFSTDIVPTAASYTWSFRAESSINSSTAEISWENTGLAGATAELLMYDADQRTLIDMKQCGRYIFDPARSRNFRVFYGSDKKSVKPDVQECGLAWPNPVAETANIPYLVKEGSLVRIEIYDLMGRLVRTLVDGYAEAGYHVAVWDRTTSGGQRVSPGIYIYRMNGSANAGRIIAN